MLCKSLLNDEEWLGLYKNQIVLVAVVCLVGLVIGLLLPRISQAIVNYKMDKSGYEMKNNYFPKLYVFTGALFTVMAFGLAFWYYPPVEAVFLCMFSVIAVVGTVVDYKLRIIPNELVLGLLVIGTIRCFVSDYSPCFLESICGFILVICIFALTAFITHVFKKGFGIGAGDLKLAGIIGIIVGYTGSIYFLVGMALSICIYCVGGMYLRLLSLKDTFPMCGFIMAGFLISVYYTKLEPLILMII